MEVPRRSGHLLFCKLPSLGGHLLLSILNFPLLLHNGVSFNIKSADGCLSSLCCVALLHYVCLEEHPHFIIKIYCYGGKLFGGDYGNLEGEKCIWGIL